MKALTITRAMRWAVAATGLAAAGWTAYATVAWARFGKPARPAADESDPLLDAFMPDYDVVERHRIEAAAPAATTLHAACDADLRHSTMARAIFAARERLLNAAAD